MLCIDCLVKDRKENKAITVTNGYALCRSCLFIFYSKMHRANEEAMKDLKVFLDHEAAIVKSYMEEESDDRADSSNV